uniref:Isopropylmalate dehydrogenase-like domain-containing protein n=1 Tax=Octopus bimaculoides TaxID=37653 RepID=A0A0L8GEM3_OCTBM
MKLGDRLFLECCKNITKEYHQIEFSNMIIDNACIQMLSHPQQFDILVLPNIYGKILSHSIQDKNIVNSTGMLLADCDMLDYLGCYRYATMIQEPVTKVLKTKKLHTPFVDSTSFYHRC